MEIENFLKGQLVWHTNFKCKVQFLSELKPLKSKWLLMVADNGTRLGEVAEHKTSLELQIFKLR